LIFSFNSRIIQLAKEERKNYRSIYYSTKEVDSNIYLVKLLNYGLLFNNWTWNFDGSFSNIDDVKGELFRETERNILNNLKNNLEGKFDITDVKLTDVKLTDVKLTDVKLTDVTHDNGAHVLKVKFKGKLKVTIRTRKDNQNYIHNEIEYPLSFTIKYSIEKDGGYFNVKIFVEPEDL